MEWRRLIFGKPLESNRESHERLNISLGLAVFAADALSSTAYATEEILIALAATPYILQANLLSIPIAISICLLMAIVVFSYRQVIRAYKDGGGAYVVAKENLGETACLIAGAALLLDYVLTVAVSVSAGAAAITSTGLVPHHLQTNLALIFVLFITFINLRGVRESAAVIAFPAYTFIVIMLALIIWGFFAPHPEHHIAQGLLSISKAQNGLGSLVINSALILAALKAFSHGCAALTGIEAISNGVKAFKEPSDKNANHTMVLMGLLLGSIFIGVTYLAFHFDIMPKHTETIISQVARATFGGDNILYYLVQITTMIILVLAANTSFAGFPRLATLLATDYYLPRQLMTLGDRLVFSNGIILLSLVSTVLIWIFNADTHALIPLYAVGVFLSFTLAQAGMVVHHQRLHSKHAGRGIAINLTGAIVTGAVTILLTYEKFFEGAWMVLLAMPVLIWFFMRIKSHYQSMSKQLSIPPDEAVCPVAIEHTVLVLVSSLNRGTIPAIQYAKSMSTRVEAVHVRLNDASTERVKRDWEKWGCNVPLVILDSPYRSIIDPILKYVDEVEDRYEHDIVTVIVPEFVTKKAWHNLLHNQTAMMLKALLRFRRGKVVTTVRYYLDE